MPERDVRVLFGYVLFFPHLIAGPILRPHELMPQLKRFRSALDARFLTGIMIFTLGAVKKLVFADQLAAIVERAFASDAALTSADYLLAVYAFAVQIYCDFSGYTDMAIGLAYMLRIRLPTNFLRPYCATSVIDFWRRWHITLSHWLRDYLYIPLGGNRHGRSRQLVNLMLTMLIGGLWHGANMHLSGVGIHAWLCARDFASAQKANAAATNYDTKMARRYCSPFISYRSPGFTSERPTSRSPIKCLPLRFPLHGRIPASFVQGNLFPILLLIVFFATHRFDRHARLRLLLRSAHMSIVWAVIACLWILAIAMRQGSSAKFIYFDF